MGKCEMADRAIASSNQLFEEFARWSRVLQDTSLNVGKGPKPPTP